MGARVPVELRIFLTAAAIVDDIGAIAVVAVFYSGDIHPGYLAGAAAVVVALALLSRSRVYLLSPYILLGVALWAFVYAGGLHATLAGVVLALLVPTRPPANLAALMTQASTIIASEARHEGEVLRHGPPPRHCTRSTQSTTDLNRPPTGCCGTPARGRATQSSRSSHWRMRAWRSIRHALAGHGWLMAAIVAGLAIRKAARRLSSRPPRPCGTA